MCRGCNLLMLLIAEYSMIVHFQLCAQCTDLLEGENRVTKLTCLAFMCVGGFSSKTHLYNTIDKDK